MENNVIRVKDLRGQGRDLECKFGSRYRINPIDVPLNGLYDGSPEDFHKKYEIVTNVGYGKPSWSNPPDSMYFECLYNFIIKDNFYHLAWIGFEIPVDVAEVGDLKRVGKGYVEDAEKRMEGLDYDGLLIQTGINWSELMGKREFRMLPVEKIKSFPPKKFGIEFEGRVPSDEEYLDYRRERLMGGDKEESEVKRMVRRERSVLRGFRKKYNGNAEKSGLVPVKNESGGIEHFSMIL